MCVYVWSYLISNSVDPSLTPEEKLTKALEAKQSQAAAQPEASKLPGYMNPAAMNPTKFQEIKEKRKMLWSKPKEVRN